MTNRDDHTDDLPPAVVAAITALLAHLNAGEEHDQPGNWARSGWVKPAWAEIRQRGWRDVERERGWRD